VPRVAITEAAVTVPMGVVTRKISDFPALAVQALARRGCQRAALTCFVHDTPIQGKIPGLLAEAGIATKPCWLFPIEPVAGGIALKHYVQLLLDRPASQRPDSIIVADDNLVESVVAGIRAAGLTPGREVVVVSLANAPAIPPVDADVHWIAIDNTAIFEACLDCLDATRRDGMIPPPTLAPLTSLTDLSR